MNSACALWGALTGVLDALTDLAGALCKVCANQTDRKLDSLVPHKTLAYFSWPMEATLPTNETWQQDVVVVLVVGKMISK